MPLEPIEPSESIIALQVAQRSTAQLIQAMQQINNLRNVGIPSVAAVPATPEETLPDGRKISPRPERPATRAISAEAMNTAYGEVNCEVFNAVKELIGL